jgi:hypothetical protein
MTTAQPATPGLTNAQPKTNHWASVFELQHTISAYETVLLDLGNHEWFDRSSAEIIPTGLADRRQFLQTKLDQLTNQTN